MEIDGVKLPIDINEDFITPFWHYLFNFYPQYKNGAGENAKSVQGYIIAISDKLNGVRGRTSDDWLCRLYEHYGIDYLQKVVDKYEK